METDKFAIIGIKIPKDDLSQLPGEYLTNYLSQKWNFYGRMMFILGDYLTKHSKQFERVGYIVTDEVHEVFENGTITGIMGMVNRSEMDIGIEPLVMDEFSTDIVDFVYPLELKSSTFITRKAEYEAHICAILQTFSLRLWTAIISTFIAMSLVYYVSFKGTYSFDKILLHVFAVLLRQSSVLKPPSMIKKLLLFSWIVGAMFICLAYDSVVLSFLSFPPINQVKDVPQLAKAVKEGRYHCVADHYTATPTMLLNSEDENLKIIGRDIQTNNLSFENVIDDFYYDRNKPNVALIIVKNDIHILSVAQNFVSEDRFLDRISAMPVRKDFCCRKLMEKFVHKMMASGLYFKLINDRIFLYRLPTLMKQEDKDTSKRVLTLTDIAPAFIFLIFGHIVSFFVFILEIVSNRMKKKCKKSNEYRIQRRF